VTLPFGLVPVSIAGGGSLSSVRPWAVGTPWGGLGRCGHGALPLLPLLLPLLLLLLLPLLLLPLLLLLLLLLLLPPPLLLLPPPPPPAGCWL